MPGEIVQVWDEVAVGEHPEMHTAVVGHDRQGWILSQLRFNCLP